MTIWHRLRSWFATPAIVPASSLDLPPAGISRRAVLGGLAGLVAMPAIVRFDAIMPVRAVADDLLKNGRLLSSEELRAELAGVIRRAFLPRLFVQLWQTSPLMGALSEADPPLQAGFMGVQSRLVPVPARAC